MLKGILTRSFYLYNSLYHGPDHSESHIQSARVAHRTHDHSYSNTRTLVLEHKNNRDALCLLVCNRSSDWYFKLCVGICDHPCQSCTVYMNMFINFKSQKWQQNRKQLDARLDSTTDKRINLDVAAVVNRKYCGIGRECVHG